jgi:carbon monoxide dehydrogenase subunit G
MGWEQEIPGTPFARHLRRYAIGVSLEEESEGTAVTLAAVQTLRGLSRLGSPMMRRGQTALLDEALDGLERALT